MDISGTWYNELGSTMVIDNVANGQITGGYTTAVSATACAKGDFPVVGLTDTDSGGEALAFSVCWKNNQSQCQSVTAWSGQAQTLNGEDQLVTYWLLTVETDPQTDWYATHVGQDVFTRQKPTAALVKQKAKLLRHAHP